MKICFVDNTNFQYDFYSIYSQDLRGAETVLINLSLALSVIGHKVTIINNCPKPSIINGVRWININSNFEIENFDLVISNGDCNLFRFANSNNNVLFSYSLQTIEKFIRKKQLISYLKYKPKICFLSNYHKNNRSKLLYFFGEINLRLSVDKIFLDTNVSDNIDNNLAIFTSRPDRNLKMLTDIWTKLIIPNNNKLRLLVTDNSHDYSDKSIIKRKLGDQRELVKDLQSARMMLIPGHKAELYCLAAEEARELCIPIVTLGIGCLAERVDHEITGFVANNQNDFANYTLNLFNNDNLWKKIRINLMKRKNSTTWKIVAKELVKQIS